MKQYPQGILRSVNFMRLRNIYILIVAILTMSSVTGCTRQTVNNENIPVTEPEVEVSNQAENQESEKEIMYDKLVGCLSLSSDEKNSVFDKVGKIIDIKNSNNNPKNGDLDILNNSIHDLLNRYTKEKIVPNENNIDDIKKYMGIFKKMHDNNINEYTPAAQIKESCLYDIINGEEIRKNTNSDIGLGNSSEFETKSIETWKYIKKILPKEALKNIDCLQTLSTTKKNNGAVGGGLIQKDGKYILSVNVSLDPTYLPYILYHEYGHYLSLNESQVDSANNWDYNQTYDAVKFKSNSYMKKFYDKFYKYTYNDMLLDASGYLFYLRHKDEFVGIYAASHYYDDFAESFACFISNNYTEEGKEKIEFFNDFPEIVELKNEIQRMLKINGLTAKRVTQ